MQIGVFSTLLSEKSLDEALSYLKSKGVNAVEIGCGGCPGKAHADPDILLNDEKKLQEFKDTIKKYDMQISALSCHTNPVHPDKKTREFNDNELTKAILLAQKLGVTIINTFSGCPGDCEGAKYSNWVTCPWPEEFTTILDYQWNDVLIPYWKEKVSFAKKHGGIKFALEMHPGFCVYNAETLLKLREAVGDEIGANFDPSHLIWQGADPVQAIKAIGKENAIFHFHAKDTKIDKYNTAINGVLDTKHYSDVLNRSWVFRTVGYGNDYAYWKDIVSALKTVGYDYVISIEHEDSLMSVNEGLTKAVDFLKEVITTQSSTGMWWA
ncbi:MAG: sugar phosphate isomerase/epimerase, partial [Oscillospiraceae bacterium]